eukprot:CAMPEP_0202950732 /NCGR_PEP_ID=MMETSP1395-20130829/25103_1 /ASSEMBLY_ACC=CAM_ASM_000871 /TAXON_ID=5961 /ORGANISM="Blepharisma japonicum, Strain Stock R1072" /LENGTH=131 /DNA_ID=CAMNT_0049655941 /DNA_START=262 /DNA_END=657 /DNA_ORIENTATION=+
MEHKFGLMELDMKDSEKTIRLMGMENSGILMETYMKESEKMIKPMEKECTSRPVELCMMVNGKMMCRKGMEKNNELMEAIMKDIISQEKSMALGVMCGKMGPNMSGSELIIKSMELVSIHDMMGENSKESD